MKLSRRQFVQSAGAVGAGLLAGCGRWPGQAPPEARVPRVGVLLSGAAGPLDAFRSGLADLGYTEGRNLQIEVRSADGRVERLPALAADLLALPVDILAAGGPPAIRAARDATDTVPIVMLSANDPVRDGSIASLAQPGGNVTGLSLIGSQLIGKRLEWLKAVVPGVARVAILWQPTSLPQTQAQEAETAVQVLGMRPQFVAVQAPEDVEPAFDLITQEHCDALLILTAAVTVAYLSRIADLGVTRRLPAIFDRREFAAAGGLMAYGPSVRAQWRYAATHVDRILKGASPTDLPVEQPREFDFVINLKTAQALGLTIPQHVLLQATEVIQ
jgi:putative tryptophan/tyrosine transport system substrate-binding protein